MSDDHDDVQSVKGKVRTDAEGTTVEIGPIAVGPDGTARAEVTFDRPVTLPLSALFPDPEACAEVTRDIQAILECDSDRFDDIFAASGLDPATDLAGSDLSNSRFVGTPGRPIDLRGWDLSGCDLTGATFEHVMVDGTTNLDGARLEGCSGAALPELLVLVASAGPVH